ncbi:hypothetical protein EVG20_g6465 [Dentipellis fragilis]|uniref:F-box domain-containing protein n=1 Tax=Dentipellis fragilis TaxID=205917 RepID=A0A4Y9YMS1_9AGAM|nr:hypothetical protein EVG20_g6465 [Dentipellis fragilis]
MPTPSLPLELWRAIIRELTYETGTLEIEYAPFSRDPVDLVSGDMQARREGKRTAVLVCKAWRQLALPMLYEVLVFDGTSEERLNDIYHTLKAERAAGEGLSRGLYVRQIFAGPDTIAFGRCVEDTICCCPHLDILTYKTTSDDFRRAQNLRRLDLRIGTLFQAAKTWETISKAIGNLPKLESLIFPSRLNLLYPDEIILLSPPPGSTISAPLLRTVVVPWDMYIFMARNALKLGLPALRDVHIKNMSLSDLYGTFHILIRDLKEAGGALSDKLVSIGFAPPGIWNPPLLNLCFEVLSQFQNLRTLRITTISMTAPDERLRHPSLASIMIYPVQNGHLPPHDPGGREAMFTDTSQVLEIIIASDFPQLHKISIIGAHQAHFTTNTQWMEKWTRQLKERGVTLDIDTLAT